MLGGLQTPGQSGRQPVPFTPYITVIVHQDDGQDDLGLEVCVITLENGLEEEGCLPGAVWSPQTLSEELKSEQPTARESNSMSKTDIQITL
ncbi:hypothetical protein Q8A67_024406 [Cirrhinus molitorella]|uniref:Uncharacterized protein n=1 Tax=Cirrhinus molitorella TaxID=172907 RepID=A0AA88P518_9TELE|nr:hypothetical protein Q8A67_024406 [Cirrhinus molitorella]